MEFSTPANFGIMALLLLAPLNTWATDPSAGCGPGGWSSGTYTMQHNDIKRTFRVYVPRGYRDNEPAPLMTYFHGWGGNENEILGVRPGAKSGLFGIFHATNVAGCSFPNFAEHASIAS